MTHRKIKFWNFIFQPLDLEFFSSFISYPYCQYDIGLFENLEFWKKSRKFFKKFFDPSFFSFQLNAKNQFVISHTVRLKKITLVILIGKKWSTKMIYSVLIKVSSWFWNLLSKVWHFWLMDLLRKLFYLVSKEYSGLLSFALRNVEKSLQF